MCHSGQGSSNNYCDLTYGGPFPTSEPETRAVSDELVRIGKTLLAVLTLHSYGKTWLVPWGFTDNSTGKLACAKLPNDYSDLVH